MRKEYVDLVLRQEQLLIKLSTVKLSRRNKKEVKRELDEMKQEYETNFAGFKPDRFYQLRAQIGDVEDIEEKFVTIGLTKLNRAYGYIQYDHKLVLGIKEIYKIYPLLNEGRQIGDLSTFIKQPQMVLDYNEKVRFKISRALLCNDPIELDSWLTLAFPHSGVNLEDHARMKPKILAAYILQAVVKGYLSIGRVMAVITILKGYSFGALCSAILLLSTDSVKFDKLYHWCDKEEVFSYGYPYFLNTMGVIHDWVRRARVVIRFRNLQTLGLDYTDLMYFKMTIGRYEHLDLRVDGELEERAKVVKQKVAFDQDGVASVGYFDYLFKHHMQNLIRSGVTHDSLGGSESERWERIIKHYINITPSGSIGQTKSPLDKKLAEVVEQNKRVWISMQSLESLIDSSENLDGRSATVVSKLEAGKLRPMLPGDVESWAAEAFALYLVENKIYRVNDEFIYEKSVSDVLNKLLDDLDNAEPNVYTFGADYKNFNIQHEIKHMQCMYECLGKIFDSQFGDDNSFAKICASLLQSLNKMQARYSHRHNYISLVRGLWTGWRATSFINTTFNLTYFRCVKDSFMNVYQYNPIRGVKVAGDDIDAQTYDEVSALRLGKMMSDMNLDLQESKQLVVHGEREFLRITVSGLEHKATGSLMRSISNFSTGDLQSGLKFAGVEQARGCCAAIDKLVLRGYPINPLKLLKQCLLDYYLQFKFFDALKGKQVVFRLNRKLETIPTINGGLGCLCIFDTPRLDLQCSVNTPTLRTYYGHATAALTAKPNNLLNAYLKSMAEVLRTRFELNLSEENKLQVIKAVAGERLPGLSFKRDLNRYKYELYKWNLTIGLNLHTRLPGYVQQLNPETNIQRILTFSREKVTLTHFGSSIDNYSPSGMVSLIKSLVFGDASGVMLSLKPIIKQVMISQHLSEEDAIPSTVAIGGVAALNAYSHLKNIFKINLQIKIFRNDLQLLDATSSDVSTELQAIWNRYINMNLINWVEQHGKFAHMDDYNYVIVLLKKSFSTYLSGTKLNNIHI